MHHQDLHNHFEELIFKYLSGNASDAEVQELETWVQADKENKKQFIAFKKSWMLSGMKQNTSNVNVEKLWNETSKQISSGAKVVEMKPKQSRRNWLSIAAVITLLAVASFLLFQNIGNDNDMMVSTSDEVKKFDLPDGSHISLNRLSSLSYKPIGDDNRRNVTLKGDAFFDVARDESHPFVIKTQNVEIEVLGTSFYVDSRENQNEIHVTVESGSVAVRSGGKEVILKPNEKAVFQKNKNELDKKTNDDSNFTSVKTKNLIFKETKLDEIVFALNRHFGVNIILENEALKNLEHTGTYKDKSLETIIESISKPTGFQSKKEKDKIIWSKIGSE